jgi:hypothetical protein
MFIHVLSAAGFAICNIPLTRDEIVAKAPTRHVRIA